MKPTAPKIAATALRIAATIELLLECVYRSPSIYFANYHKQLEFYLRHQKEMPLLII